MSTRLAPAPLALLLAACAGAPPAPPAAAPAPQAPPPPAHLEPPNTAPAPPVSVVAPKAVASAAPASAPRAAPTQDALDRPQIERAFDAHGRYFWKLYTARLQARPQLHGRMLVSFVINPDGTTRDVTLVDSDLADPALERAILGEVAAMTFPPARAATPVQSYPLVFSSSKAPRK